MSTVYGVSTTKYRAGLPRLKGQTNAHVKVLMDTYVLPAAAFSASDFINIGKLPIGARVLDAGIVVPDTGTTGAWSLGTVADPDGFVAAGDSDGSGGLIKKSSTEALIGTKFAVETDVIIDCTEATDVGTDVVVTAWVEFIVD